MELECLAIMGATATFRTVLPMKFKVITDHANMKYLANYVTHRQRLQTWSAYLSQWDIEFQHIAGKRNVVADHLSRYPPHGSVAGVIGGTLASITTFTTRGNGDEDTETSDNARSPLADNENICREMWLEIDERTIHEESHLVLACHIGGFHATEIEIEHEAPAVLAATAAGGTTVQELRPDSVRWTPGNAARHRNPFVC